MTAQKRPPAGWAWLGVVLLVTVGSVGAEDEQEATTLVGRGKDITIIEKNGKTHSINTEGLVLKNRATVIFQERPAPEEFDRRIDRERILERARALEIQRKKSAIQNKKIVPEMCPAKKALIEKLREYQKWGTLYFYTLDNKPVSNEELTKRFDSGNIEDLKIVDSLWHEYPIMPKPVKQAPAKKSTNDTDAPPGPRKRK